MKLRTSGTRFGQTFLTTNPRVLCVSGVFVWLTIAGGVVGQEVQQPVAGSPARKAILDGLREHELLQRLSADWKAKIVFSHVVIRQAKDWAWVVASPQSQDEKQIVEPTTCVMHEKGGRWQVVEFVPDNIAPADNPEAAYRGWRAQFLHRHPNCPPRIFPEKFD